tara:strand:+ start:421 stop:573 length:153 start_codon:yes stop_codon:yes gene_type:complete
MKKRATIREAKIAVLNPPRTHLEHLLKPLRTHPPPALNRNLPQIQNPLHL